MYSTISDWYETDEIAPSIWRVREKYYRADYRCNMYVIKGMTRDLVIDAGLGLANLRHYLRPLTWAPTLVLSHAHYDHIGAAHEFDERLIHAAEADILAAPTRENTYADILLAGEDFSRRPWNRFSARHWEPTPAPATGLLAEGDIIDLGNRGFEVLHTPGHSWGSICLWDQRNRLMICADTVYSGEIFDQLSCSDIPTYVKTMDRLRLLPVDLALPGHGQILSGAEFRGIAVNYILEKRPREPAMAG